VLTYATVHIAVAGRADRHACYGYRPSRVVNDLELCKSYTTWKNEKDDQNPSTKVSSIHSSVLTFLTQPDISKQSKLYRRIKCKTRKQLLFVYNGWLLSYTNSKQLAFLVSSTVQGGDIVQFHATNIEVQCATPFTMRGVSCSHCVCTLYTVTVCLWSVNGRGRENVAEWPVLSVDRCKAEIKLQSPMLFGFCGSTGLYLSADLKECSRMHAITFGYVVTDTTLRWRRSGWPGSCTFNPRRGDVSNVHPLSVKAALFSSDERRRQNLVTAVGVASISCQMTYTAAMSP